MFSLFVCLLVPLLIAVGGYYARFLTLDGACAAVIVGFATAESGWERAAMIIAFFLCGSFATKYRHATKESLMPFRPPPDDHDDDGTAHQHPIQPTPTPTPTPTSTPTSTSTSTSTPASTSTISIPPCKGRNMWQVAATGGIPAAFCAARHVLPSPYTEWYPWLFFGYIACCNGDTLASELGMLARQKPRLITNITRIVKPGVDGGITAFGTACSIVGGAAIGAITLSLGGIYLGALWGGLGSALDSIFGALLQPSSQNASFTSSSSKEKYSTKDCVHFFHWQRMNNIVNVISSLLTALLCALVGSTIWLNILCSSALCALVATITYYHGRK